MPHPGLLLAGFAVGVALLLLLAWPRRGLVARVRRLRRVTARVRVEDTLKYLFHRGVEGRDVHPDALAGALQVRQALAADLLEQLTQRGLVEPHGPDGHRLTEGGRREALRIVRAHRILEQYLADRTGIGPEEWHAVAEEEEHHVSPDELEALAERLGQPRFDPHGDPIPTATGELPIPDGAPLTALALGEAGVITHLEDEPADAFDRLVAMGFALGRTVIVRERGPQGAIVELDGRALTVPRACERAISVRRGADEPAAPARTLADLEPGEGARVRRLSSACRGAQRRRLLDLGVVPGTQVVAELASVSGDPVAYRIRGALIALRRHQAAWIEIEEAA